MRMHIKDLHEKMRQGLPEGELVLDVRDEDEYAEGHVPGSRNIPLDRVTQHVTELLRFERIYVHCGGGGRAGRATEALRAAGLTQVVHICESGMRSWVEAGFPVEK